MLPSLFTVDRNFAFAYGVMLALGILTGLNVATMLAARHGLKSQSIASVGIFGALAGILGARIPELLVNLPNILKNPADAISLVALQSSGVFYGGLIVAICAIAIMARQLKLPLGRTLDVFAPGIAIGQAIGKLGCFAGGCCWGTSCEYPWAVTFRDPLVRYTTGVPLNQPLHPTQLYEASLSFLVFCVTLTVERKPHRPGEIFAYYLILSGLSRFATEYFRAPLQPNPLDLPFSNSQLVSAALVVIGATIQILNRQAAARSQAE